MTGIDPAAQHAVVLGQGLMGCDIAAIFLAGGWCITATEPNRDAWPGCLERVRSSPSQLGADPERAEHLFLVAALDEVGFADAACVVEAVPERLDLKRRVFSELDHLRDRSTRRSATTPSRARRWDGWLPKASWVPRPAKDSAGGCGA